MSKLAVLPSFTPLSTAALENSELASYYNQSIYKLNTEAKGSTGFRMLKTLI